MRRFKNSCFFPGHFNCFFPSPNLHLCIRDNRTQKTGCGNLLREGMYLCKTPSPWELKIHLLGLSRDRTTGGFLAYDPLTKESYRVPGQLTPNWFTPVSESEADDFITWIQDQTEEWVVSG